MEVEVTLGVEVPVKEVVLVEEAVWEAVGVAVDVPVAVFCGVWLSVAVKEGVGVDVFTGGCGGVGPLFLEQALNAIPNANVMTANTKRTLRMETPPKNWRSIIVRLTTKKSGL